MHSHAVYQTATDLTQEEPLLAMMLALYSEDCIGGGPRGLTHTLEHFLGFPEAGRMVLIELDSQLCGYAILVPFWSNEFGGNMVFVDELYIMPAFRSRGLGRGLFTMIERDRPFDAVGVFLEVSRTNLSAWRLYESVGLVERSQMGMAKRFSTNSKNEIRSDD
jgi:ribosomal protein S18 acetylase RimI-like enzyme